jgi:tetratricopeptide (TPR) repeat protein
LALFTFYANAERVDEADDAMRLMKDKLPPAQTPLALALCEEALSRLDAAEQHYLDARTKQPNDGLTQQRLAAFYMRLQRTDKAEAVLRGLLDPTLRFPRGAAAETVAWARRQLAMLRAESADAAGYAEALKLLEANGNRSLADVRATAFVKATRPQDRAEALRAVEETMKVQPLMPDEQFRLVKLYEVENDWSNAHEQLEALLNVDSRNPEYLAYFIAVLLQRNQQAEARMWLAKLEKLEPGSARVKKWQRELR